MITNAEYLIWSHVIVCILVIAAGLGIFRSSARDKISV